MIWFVPPPQASAPAQTASAQPSVAATGEAYFLFIQGRTLEAKGKAGLNRVEWNLRYDSPRVIAMRTMAPDNTRIWNEPRFRDAS